MSEWKEVQETNNVWKYEKEGDQIEGVLVSKQERTKDVSARYHIDTGKGIVMVWGTAVLDNRMMSVNVGEQVRITYKKTEEKNKKKVHIFKVEIKV